jgi:hypothetical protein
MAGTEECVATEAMAFGNPGVRLLSPGGAQLLILIGAILALIGVSVTVFPLALAFLGTPTWNVFALNAFLAVVGGIGALLLGTGGFLIFLGFAQARQDSLPWSLVVAVVMLAAGIVAAVGAGTEALVWLGTSSFTVDFGRSLYPLYLVREAAWVAVQASFIVGLLALARTLLKKP